MGKRLTADEHLELAREDLAIAESGDSKREAYKRAAEHVAAYIEATGESNRKVCIAIQTSESKFYKLMAWREAGYPKGTTPFTMADPDGSKPTDRAAKSHARKVLKDSEQREEVIDALDDEALSEVANAATERLYERQADEADNVTAEDKPTARKLGVDPAKMHKELIEGWISTHIDRTLRKAQAMHRTMEKEGLRFPENRDEAECRDDLLEIERLVSEVRAAVDERVRDAKLAATTKGTR